MFAYLCLAGAIVLEVCGTMLLPVSQNFTRFLPTVTLAGCYLGAFYLLTFATKAMPIAVVYATWSGAGVFLIALMGYVIFRQSLEWPAILGMGLIISGVALVNIYSSAHG
ncbi:MAG: QacE family quaternary ammonium compound efflux SMR transporter [Sneathiella sp.]|nr:QacE family quaternary ammonium compound efflux SMR transporter [Sneathiella sp.]